MIEAEEYSPEHPTGNFQDDAVFLLNNEKQSKNKQHIKKGGWEI